PGLRELGTWGIDPERLGAYFAEFRPFLDQCRFDNCRHLAEPGCGVRQAAERGAFDPDRLVSYQRLYEEVSVPSWSSDRRRGGKYPSLYWPIHRSTVCWASRRDTGGSGQS